jgi:hypothetical protein
VKKKSNNTILLNVKLRTQKYEHIVEGGEGGWPAPKKEPLLQGKIIIIIKL